MPALEIGAIARLAFAPLAMALCASGTIVGATAAEPSPRGPLAPGFAQSYGVWTVRCAPPEPSPAPAASCQVTAARSVRDGASVPIGISIDIGRATAPSLALALGQGRFAPELVRLQVDDGLPVEAAPGAPDLALIGGDSGRWLLAGMRTGQELVVGFTIAASGARTVLTVPLAGFADALDAVAAHHTAAEGVKPPPPHRLTRPGQPQTP